MPSEPEGSVGGPGDGAPEPEGPVGGPGDGPPEPEAGAVRVGDLAPGFELPRAPGEDVDVAAHLGREKVVLLFFPLAFSAVCTRELGAFRDDWDGWEALGARVFAISVDSPFVTRRFREEEGLPFPILSDFNKDVSRRYGVLAEDMLGLHGVARRSVFVIGGDGRVAYAWVADDPGVEPDYGAVRAALERA